MKSTIIVFSCRFNVQCISLLRCDALSHRFLPARLDSCLCFERTKASRIVLTSQFQIWEHADCHPHGHAGGRGAKPPTEQGRGEGHSQRNPADRQRSRLRVGLQGITWEGLGDQMCASNSATSLQSWIHCCAFGRQDLPLLEFVRRGQPSCWLGMPCSVGGAEHGKAPVPPLRLRDRRGDGTLRVARALPDSH